MGLLIWFYFAAICGQQAAYPPCSRSRNSSAGGVRTKPTRPLRCLQILQRTFCKGLRVCKRRRPGPFQRSRRRVWAGPSSFLYPPFHPYITLGVFPSHSSGGTGITPFLGWCTRILGAVPEVPFGWGIRLAVSSFTLTGRMGKRAPHRTWRRGKPCAFF